MRKTKAILVILLVTLISLIPFKVKAHDVELDPESVIWLPMLLVNGKGAIDVSSTEEVQSLYYQAIQISNDDAKQVENIRNDGKKELDIISEELEKLDNEKNNLKEDVDKAYEEYQALVDSQAEQEEIEEAKDKYDIALENYNNKVDEYNKKVEENNTKVDEINKKVDDLTPTFVEENWLETTDGNFELDLSTFSGQKAMVIWAKLETKDGNTYYDEEIYTINGTKEDEIKVESITLDRTTLNMETGDNYTLTATVVPSNATNKNIIWTSNNEKVATVENGRITAVSEGRATITAETEDGGYTATCEVIVGRKSNVEKDEPIDNTTVPDTKLPQTGEMSYIFIAGILGLGITGIIIYNKRKKMKF